MQLKRPDMEIVCFVFLLSLPCFDGGLVQKNFVKVIRAVEAILGISVGSTTPNNFPSTLPSTNFIAAITSACQSNIFTEEATAVLLDGIPMLVNIGQSYDLKDTFMLNPFNCHDKEPIVIK